MVLVACCGRNESAVGRNKPIKEFHFVVLRNADR